MNAVDIIVGDVRKRLNDLPDGKFQSVITSPPYWGLRDYNHPDQLGLEPDPRDYLRHMVEIFRMIRPKLRNDGTLWINMGDCYVTGTSSPHKGGKRGSSQKTQDAQNAVPRNGYPFDLAPKNLVMMPARLALALQDDGWILRSQIIWEKSNPMPESIYDRPTTSHEYVYLFSKSARYFYDFEAGKEPVTGGSHPRQGDSYDTKAENRGSRGKTRSRAPVGWDTSPNGRHDGIRGRYPEHKNNESFSSAVVDAVHDRNMRTVWKIPTAPFKGAHFATYPPALVIKCLVPGTGAQACELCGAAWLTVAIDKVPTGGRESGNLGRKFRIDAGGNPDLPNAHQGFGFPWEPSTSVTERRPTCKCEGATGSGRSYVLDPFGGAGTTGLVASRMNRGCTLIELNKKYAKLAARRIHDDAPLFAGLLSDLAGIVADQELNDSANADREAQEGAGNLPDLTSAGNHSD
jgi:DNA modification methylase